MYKEKLVGNENGASRSGYQTVESGAGFSGNESSVPDIPQTFFSQVKKAREENVGCCNFCMAFFALLLGSIMWTIVLIIIITVPIVMIVIGAEYFHDCPVQKMIPICVIVAGCVSLLSNVLYFVERFRRYSEDGIPKTYAVIRWINIFTNLFLAAWFVATCYYVYSATNVEFNNANLANYCHPHLYGFVYWLLNFIFIFFGTMIIVSSLVMCLAVMCC